jgi:hypothetical protein
MSARFTRGKSRPRRVGHLVLSCFVATLALFQLTSPEASAAGGSSAASSGGSSAAGSSFPARVEDFATCTLDAPGWTEDKNRPLSDAYNADLWTQATPGQDPKGVQELLADLIGKLKCTPQPDISKLYISVLFFDESSQPPALARVVVHRYHGGWKIVDPPDTNKPEVYGSRIGDFELYDLRLLPEGFLVSSQYLVATSSNPLLSQIPGVIGLIAGGVKGNIAVPTPPAALLRSPSRPPSGPKEGEGGPKECQDKEATYISTLHDCSEGTTGTSQQSFLIRRVTVPPAFMPHRLRQPSVIPQIAITDQLVFTSQLESYMLESLRLRAKNDQEVRDLEQGLFTAYHGCRAHVTADLAASVAGTPPYLVARLFDPAGGPPVSNLCLRLTVRNFQGAALQQKVVQLEPLHVGKPQTLCWAIPGPLHGDYLATAEVLDKQRPLADELEDAAAATFLSVPPPPPASSLSGSLTAPSATPTWGDPFSLGYTVNGTKPGDPVNVELFAAATGKKMDIDPPPLAQPAPATGPATGTFILPTAQIGLGSRLAVLEVVPSTTNLTTPVASASFRVVGGLPGTEPGASAVAAGPACLIVDDSKLTSSTSSQPAAIAYGNIAAAYSWLLTQATPPPPAAPAPTTYTLGKLTRYAFSLGVAGLLPSNLHKVPAPSNNPLSWVALDIHPFLYDETRFSPDIKERFRGFLGIAATPNIGVVGGLGMGIYRGLTLEGGYALLLANIENKTQPIPLPTSGPRTHRGALGAFFVGVGYSLQ